MIINESTPTTFAPAFRNTTARKRRPSILTSAICSAMLLVAAIAPAASAAEAILTDDTYAAATPMGTKRFLVLNRNQNVYLKFDLSNLPAGTAAEQISKATLKLWVRTSEGTSISVRNLIQAAGNKTWTESTLTGSTPVTLEEF